MIQITVIRSAVREDDDSTNDENNQQKDERRHMMDSTRLKATPRTPRYSIAKSLYSFGSDIHETNRRTVQFFHSLCDWAL